MRLQFPISTLSALRTELRSNPTATGVVLTQAELIDVVDELLQTGDSNAVLLGNKPRTFSIDARSIEVSIYQANGH